MATNKVLLLTADGFEDSELFAPKYRLEEAGYKVLVAAPEKGKVTGKHGYEVKADMAINDVDDSENYDLLFLPGGKAPAKVREVSHALDIAREFAEEGKPIAAICHGPQVLVSAGVLEGRRATCYKTVVPELEENGVNYVDKEVVVDGNIVTSRQPSDIPAFNREMMKLLGR